MDENQRCDNKLFSHPDLKCISIGSYAYRLKICHASFRNFRMLYDSDGDSLAPHAPRLTFKACHPSIHELQDVKLVLKVVTNLLLLP